MEVENIMEEQNSDVVNTTVVCECEHNSCQELNTDGESSTSCPSNMKRVDKDGDCSSTMKNVEEDGGCQSQCGNGSDFVESDVSSCSTSSCSTRRNSFSESSDFEITLNSLFRTPSATTTSHTSSINSPINNNSANILDGIDILLQRISSERFAELRNIQLSERPVTNGFARGNIETFLRRSVHGLTEEERLLEEDANRPAHVVSDVQQLQEQSVVQTTLQNDFRIILERALLSRMPSSNIPTQTSIQNAPLRTRNLVGGSDFRARLESIYGGRPTSSSNGNTSSSPRAVRTPSRPTSQNVRVRRSSIPHRQSVPIPPPPAPPLNGEILSPPQDNEDIVSSPNFTIDAGLQLLAQNIADDLNRLESLQVVSGMLRGDFRSHLETSLLQRISNAATGNQTQEFIRSLPGRRPHTRPTSTTGRSQHALNAGVSSELNTLKQQIEEMRRMLAMSMELQMDTQRAIRQEVTAVFSTFMQDYLAPRAASSPSTQPTIFHPPVSTPVASGQCVICVDRCVDTVLYQCGHMCVCNQCGLQLKMDGHNCPMCRAPIRDVIRAYQTQ